MTVLMLRAVTFQVRGELAYSGPHLWTMLRSTKCVSQAFEQSQ